MFWLTMRFDFAIGALLVVSVVAKTAGEFAALPPPPTSSRTTALDACDPRDFGAKGDGSADDTDAINNAISNCSHVELREGTFKSGSVRLRSELTLTVAAGATLLATSDKSRYDSAEPNQWDSYQDYGHSHFHNSFLWGEGLSNVTINGEGLIDGAGHLTSSGSAHDAPNKMFSLKSCSGVRLEGLTLKNGGWFTLLANDIEGLHIQDVTVRAQRDGFDIISSRHVRVYGVDIRGGGDDAVVLKSDYATGKALLSYDVVVANSILGCGCNALQFGSETVGNFTDIHWENITVTEAGKAGIGIVSMDGSHISRVSYKNITMSKVTTPVYMYIGARSRRPEPGTHVGSISDISIEDISATDIVGKRGNWTATLDGQPADNDAGVDSLHVVGPNISVKNATFTYEGGARAATAEVVPPHPYDKYPPRYLGDRPSYGWYLRNAVGVSLSNVKVDWEAEDERPAVVVEGACDVTVDKLTAAHGADAVDYDVGLRGGCTGVKVTNSPGIVTKQLDDFASLQV